VGFPSRKHQFRPGLSGNPAGSSKARRITEALLALIEEKGADKILADVWLTHALKGDHRFFSTLLDRIEGPAGPPIEQTAAMEDVQSLRDHLNRRRRKAR